MASPAQIVDAIKQLTQKTHDLQAPAHSINPQNGPLLMVGQGPYPRIITGLADIVTTETTILQQMQPMPSVPAGKDSDAIFEAHREASISNRYGLTFC